MLILKIVGWTSLGGAVAAAGWALDTNSTEILMIRLSYAVSAFIVGALFFGLDRVVELLARIAEPHGAPKGELQHMETPVPAPSPN